MRHRIRCLLIALPMLLCTAIAAQAELSVRIGVRGAVIGINMPAYPRLVLVPDSPVYYASRTNANYFFYDGLYWVLAGDDWYVSDWYNGPWDWVSPDDVPLFVLRVPVRYYRHPPHYFRGWRADGPPRWHEHWGNDWHHRHAGWDQWDPRSCPAPAPLPSYQRRYSGRNYPGAIQRRASLRSQHYRYQPRETVTQRHYEGRPDRDQQKKHEPQQRKRHKDKDAKGGRSKH